MRIRVAGWWLVLVLGCARAQDVSQLSFMSGCWQGPGGTEEQWMRPLGGTLFGMARTVVNGKTVFWEFLQIKPQDGGLVLFVQHSRNPQGVVFRATRISETEAVFENPDHDFPQRILYRKQPGGGLLGRIDGQEKGKPKAVDFPFTRVKCD